MTAAFLTLSPSGIEVRLGNTRPCHTVYVRRRLMVGLVVALVGVVPFGARIVLADRGGVPASTPAIRPASESDAAPPAVVTGARSYVVNSGDTLWRLAEFFHGDRSVADYVESLVAANGGTSLQIGQVLILP